MMFIPFKKIFLVLLVAKCYGSTTISIETYGNLIWQIYDRYGTSGIIFATSVEFQQIELLTFISAICRDLSNAGVVNLVVNFSQLEERINFYYHRVVRPMIVVIVHSMSGIREFEDLTERMKMSYPIWMVIFMDSGDVPICKFCRNPPGNEFRLTYDSELVVSCCNTAKLEEWWSKDGNTTKVLPVGESIDGKIRWEHNESLFFRRYGVAARQIRVAVVKDHIFFSTKFANNSTNKPEYTGLFGEILEELRRLINFTMPALIESDLYGSWDEKNGWSGIVGRLSKNEADLGVAVFTMTKRRLEVVDFTLPLLTAVSKLYMKKPDGGGVKWSAYLQAFEMKIWATIVGIIITTPALLTLIKFNTRQHSLWSILSENYLYVWGIFCQQGLAEFPAETPPRIAYLTIFLTAIVVSAAYSASLISFLTTSSVDLPFNTIENFAKQEDYKLIVMRDSADYDLFSESKDEVIRKLFKLMKPKKSLPMTANAGFQQICNEKVVFYVSDAFQQAQSIYLPCEIVHIETGRIESLAMTLPRGSQWTRLINYHIQRFQDNGMLNRLRQKYFIKGNPAEAKHEAVNMGGIAPILAVLGGGILLSLLILFFEIIRSISTRRKFLHEKKIPKSKRYSRYYNSLPKNLTPVRRYCP